MRKYIKIGFLAAALAATTAANAAGYLKFDSVEGQSTKPAPTAPNGVEPDGRSAQGLLLPAVQKVRDPATGRDAKKKKGNVEYSRKVEEGRK